MSIKKRTILLINSKKYKRLDKKQRKLKSALHTDRRVYYQYRVDLSSGKKVKPPFSLKSLHIQENEINKIRNQLNKSPATIVKDLETTFKHLRAG